MEEKGFSIDKDEHEQHLLSPPRPRPLHQPLHQPLLLISPDHHYICGPEREMRRNDPEDDSYYEEELLSGSEEVEEYSVVSEDEDAVRSYDEEIIYLTSDDEELASQDSSHGHQRYDVETVTSSQSDASDFHETPEPSLWKASSQHIPLTEVEEVEEVEELDEVEEVNEVEELVDVEELEELNEVEDVDEVQEVNEAEEVDQLNEADEAEELDEVQELEDLDEVEKLNETEKVDKVEEVEVIDEVEGNEEEMEVTEQIIAEEVAGIRNDSGSMALQGVEKIQDVEELEDIEITQETSQAQDKETLQGSLQDSSHGLPQHDVEKVGSALTDSAVVSNGAREPVQYQTLTQQTSQVEDEPEQTVEISSQKEEIYVRMVAARASTPSIASTLAHSDQGPQESTQYSPTSPQRTVAILDHSLVSPKPKPLPETRAPEDSIMHQTLDRNDWTQLLKFMEKLRRESPTTIAYELTKTDQTLRATVLHRVIAKCPLTVTKLLLSIVPFDSRHDILLLPDMHGNTPLHVACANLQIQSKNNSIDDSIIKTLAVGAPEAHDIANDQGDIPISLLLTSPAMTAKLDPDLLAVESQAEDLIRRILQDRPDLSSAQNKQCQTLLHVATHHRAHERVSILLLDSAGYTAGLSDSQGRLPLHSVAAVVSGHNPPLSLVERLLVAAPEAIATPCSVGNTPLHWLIRSIATIISSPDDQSSFGMEQFAEMLLGRSDDESMCPLLVRNKERFTPLHYCAHFAVPAPIVRILMQSHFASKAADIVDSHRATPFHTICASASIAKLVEHIVEIGTYDASTKRDDKGRTPLHVAAENSFCTEAAIRATIDINPKAAKIENSKGRMPFHLAVRKKASELVVKALLYASPKAVKSVFEGDNGVVHEMCQYKASASIIQLTLHLYPEGAQQANKFQNLPLHVATAYRCDLATIKTLVKAFPDACTRQNKHKDVPLHYATSYKELKAVINFLVKAAPSSAMIPNEKDKTPLDLCKENGTAAIIAEALDEVANHPSKKRRKSHMEQESSTAPQTPTTSGSKKVDSIQETLERSRTFKVPSKAVQNEPKDEERRSKSREIDEQRSRSPSRDRRGRSKSRERSKSRDKSNDKKSKKRGKSVDMAKKSRTSVEREEAKQLRKREKSIDPTKKEGKKKTRKVKKDLSKSLGNMDYNHKSERKTEASRRKKDGMKKELSRSVGNLNYHYKGDLKGESSPKKSKSHRSRSTSPSRRGRSKSSRSLACDEEDTKPPRRRSTTESEVKEKIDVVRKVTRRPSDNAKNDKPPKSPGRPPLSPGTFILKKSKASMSIKEEIADGSMEDLPPTASIALIVANERNSLPKKSKSKSGVVENSTSKKKKSILKNSPTSSEKRKSKSAGVCGLSSPLPANLIQFDANAPDEVSLQMDSPHIRMKKALQVQKFEASDDSNESVSIDDEIGKSRKESTSMQSTKKLNESSGSILPNDNDKHKRKSSKKLSKHLNDSSGAIGLHDEMKKHRKESSKHSSKNLNESIRSTNFREEKEKVRKKSSKQSLTSFHESEDLILQTPKSSRRIKVTTSSTTPAKKASKRMLGTGSFELEVASPRAPNTRRQSKRESLLEEMLL